MRTLKELLPQKSLSFQREIDEKTVFYIAKRVMIEEYGIRGGESIIPILYKDKVLFLSPQSSLWSSEIVLQKKYLCQKMNQMIGMEVIQEIKIAR
ncbi:MAG: hypothetical protein ACSLEX_00790 [Minisyncoccota bacterium]